MTFFPTYDFDYLFVLSPPNNIEIITRVVEEVCLPLKLPQVPWWTSLTSLKP
jgi:hypothetical protein